VRLLTVLCTAWLRFRRTGDRAQLCPRINHTASLAGRHGSGLFGRHCDRAALSARALALVAVGMPSVLFLAISAFRTMNGYQASLERPRKESAEGRRVQYGFQLLLI
jgi:hypothetical protein